MAVDMRLVRKGKGEPREGLLKQGEAHIALGKQYAEALIESGWSSEDTVELEKNVVLLRSKRAPAAEAREQEEDEPVDAESRAISEAKAFIRRLRNALPRALREAKEGELHADAFEIRERLGRSAKVISAYLTRVRPSVEKLDDDLRKHFAGKTASELLDNVKNALAAAERPGDALHPAETAEVLAYYDLKGRILEGIEDLNRAGRIAFEGQGEVVGKFNKDILLRARHA